MSIEAIKQMVEALERLATAQLADGTYADRDCKITFAIAAGRKAIAEEEKQEQGEPVAWETFALKHANGTSLSYNKPTDLPKYLGCRPLYTHPQPKRKLLTDEQIKRLIVEFGKEFNDFDSLPEVCLLVEYDPDIGRIPPRWDAKWHVFQAVRYVLHAAHGIKGEA